jgi:hypothetical protein
MTLDEDGSVMSEPDVSSIVVNEPLPPLATKLTDTGDVDVGVNVEVEVEGEDPDEPEEPDEPELVTTGVHCA